MRAVLVPVDLLEAIITGPDCHCYQNDRHRDDHHYFGCAWGRLQVIVDLAKRDESGA